MQIRSFARALALTMFAGGVFAQATAPAQPAAPAQPTAPAKPANPAVPAAVPAAGLPDAKDIFAKFVEATGGEKAYAKLKNRVTEGTMEIKPMGIKAKFKMTQGLPANMKMVMEVDQMGKIEQGCDGTHAWEDNPMSGPRLLSGDELEETKRQADFLADIHPNEVYSEMKTTGLEKVGESECYVVDVKTKTGNPRTMYFDKTSNLLVRMKMKVKNQMGEIESEVSMSDYREFEGVKIPYTNSVKIAVGPGIEQVLKIEKLAHNVELPADAFKPSADVQELIDKESKGDKKDAAPEAPKKDEPKKDEPKKDEPKKEEPKKDAPKK